MKKGFAIALGSLAVGAGLTYLISKQREEELAKKLVADAIKEVERLNVPILKTS